MTSDLQKTEDELILQVDPVPGAIQLYAFLSFVVGAILGYMLTSSLLGLGACSVVGIFAGVVIGTICSAVVERGLQSTWRSNRFLHLSADRIAFVFAGEERRHIVPTEHINVTAWHFQTRRRSRVPKGWYVVGVALEQDDIYLPVYALVSPEDFEALETKSLYRELIGRRSDYKVNEDVRLAGEQRRLLTAETARSIDGVEMRTKDFDYFVQYLQARFPEWMPQSS